MTAARATFRRLLVEEIRALPRGRFVLPGTAALAALLLALGAFVATGPLGLESFLIVAYLILPVAVAGIAAGQAASIRATRVSHALYSAPVRERDALAAKLAATGVAAALGLVAPLPFFAVASRHVALPAHLPEFVLVGAGVSAFGLALGGALGVLLAGRSTTAPVALAVAFMTLSLLAVPYAVDVHSRDGGADPVVARLLRASPHVLLADAARLQESVAPLSARDPGRALATVAFEAAALLGIAFRAYTREQSPEGWEAPAPRRALLAGALVAALLLPVAVGAPGYDAVPLDESRGRSASGYFRNATAALAPRDAAPADAGFGAFYSNERPALRVGEENARDLLVLLPVPEGRALFDVHARIEGLDGLEVEPHGTVIVGHVPDPERAPTPARFGRSATGETGAVVRVPVAVTPREALDLTGTPFHLTVTVTYRVEGEDESRDGEARVAFRADVPNARAEMALAGAPLLALATAAAVHRRLRVG